MKNKKNSWRIAYIDGKFSKYKETDFWRLGPMKNFPVLFSLSLVMFVGIILTIVFK
tara:strand:+ start:1024 stop:1191 length:168 start_codon:yes stop_codon:yes gene_type:complete